jgi:hypothetical protein
VCRRAGYSKCEDLARNGSQSCARQLRAPQAVPVAQTPSRPIAQPYGTDSGAALTGQRTALARRFLVHCDLKAEPPMKPHPSANEGGKTFFSLHPDKARLAPHCTSRTGRSALRATETAGGAQGRRRTGSIVPHQRSRRFEFSVQVTNRGFRIATPRQASVRGSSSGPGIN